jgi:hypothetical protein
MSPRRAIQPPLYPSTRADYFAELELAAIDGQRAVSAIDFEEAANRAARFLNLINTTTGDPNPDHDRIRRSAYRTFYPDHTP